MNNWFEGLCKEMNTKFHWTLGIVLASWISTIGTLQAPLLPKNLRSCLKTRLGSGCAVVETVFRHSRESGNPGGVSCTQGPAPRVFRRHLSLSIVGILVFVSDTFSRI